MAREKDIELYKNAQFFHRNFPFSFCRMRHAAGTFTEHTLHQREFWKIIYLVSGSGEKIINDTRYPLKPGGLFLVHPDDRTSFRIDPPQIELCNILFLPELLRDGLADLKDDFQFFSILQRNFSRQNERREQLYILDTDRNIDRLVRNLEQEFTRQPANFRALIRLNLLEMLIRLCRKAGRSLRQQSDFVEYIDHRIETRFAGEFLLDELAERLGVTKHHLCRLYRARRGTTIMDALRNRRLQQARLLLACQDTRSISEICYACGFNDLSYFYRCFTAAFGSNPGDYRRSFGLD